MENPATWGEAERVVDQVLAQDEANNLRPSEEMLIGLSLDRRITDALREAGLLREAALPGSRNDVRDILTGAYGLVGEDDTPTKALARIAYLLGVPKSDWRWS